MRIVGLCGYIGSGKSTAARALESEGYVVYPFAHVLKDMLRVLGLSEHQLCGDGKGEPSIILGGLSTRHAMQTLGTLWGRDSICPDIWIRAWWRRVSMMPAVVVDDVRFSNEVEFLRRKGATLIRVNRPGCGLSDHASERMDFRPDAVVGNDGTACDLADLIRAAVN